MWLSNIHINKCLTKRDYLNGFFRTSRFNKLRMEFAQIDTQLLECINLQAIISIVFIVIIELVA